MEGVRLSGRRKVGKGGIIIPTTMIMGIARMIVIIIKIRIIVVRMITITFIEIKTITKSKLFKVTHTDMYTYLGMYTNLHRLIYSSPLYCVDNIHACIYVCYFPLSVLSKLFEPHSNISYRISHANGAKPKPCMHAYLSLPSHI